MSLRFFKKADGTKILQQKSEMSLYWKDVPIVEEKKSPSSRLIEAISQDKLRGKLLTIVVSNTFYDELFNENLETLYNHCKKGIASFYGCRIYKADNMNTDFKILQEIL